MTINNNPTTAVSLDALAVGRSSTTPFITIFSTRNPTSGDINYTVQQRWYNTTNESEWILTGYSIVSNVKSANWQPISQSAVAVTETLTGNSGGAVGVDGANNINVVGDGTTINIVGNPATHTLTASIAGDVITTVNGGTGSATGSGNAITIAGGTGITTTATGSTVTVSTSGSVATTYNADSGSATPSAHVLTISGGTSGLTTTGAGSTIDLAGTLGVANGGTGDMSFTANAPIIGGTTSTGPLQSASSGIGNAGWVLTSTDTSSAPTFQAPGGGGGGITTINGDMGFITGSTVTIYAHNSIQGCGSTVLFSNTGTTSTLNVSDVSANTLLGSSTGNATLSGSDNTGFGSGVLSVLTSGSLNTCIGANVGTNITSGASNVGLGNGALGALVSGNDNTAIGINALATTSRGFNTTCGAANLSTLTSGTNNIALGYHAGSLYTSSESSNIIIGSFGTAGESNVIRIGAQGTGTAQQSTCYIAGIAGVTVSSSAAVLINTSTGQLGTVSSSRRYKNNIVSIDAEPVSILNLHPVSFTYKAEKDLERHYGLIAEEVHETFPELVVYDQEGRPDSVKYHELPALLLAEIQRLNERIIALERKSA